MNKIFNLLYCNPKVKTVRKYLKEGTVVEVYTNIKVLDAYYVWGCIQFRTENELDNAILAINEVIKKNNRMDWKIEEDDLLENLF